MDGNKTRRRPQSLFWIPYVLCGLSMGGLLFFMDVHVYQPNGEANPRFVGPLEDVIAKGFLIKTPVCQIPEMHPMDPSVVKFIKDPKPIVCNNGTPPLVDSNLTSIFLLQSSFIWYDISDIGLLNCCYIKFWRTNPKKNEVDNKVRFDNKCIEFYNSTEIIHEFIKVICLYNSSNVYEDFFSFVPPIEENKKEENFVPNKNVPLNVLVMGLDAISRLNFHRQMPKTVNYLLQNISAVELLGYNKVGDNTFPNLVPLLTGYSEDELVNVCWPTLESHFDDCPFLWKKYKENGYTTAFTEDSAWMGVFHFVKRGFVEKPTDYYWRSFNYEAEKQIGNEYNMNVYECVGSRPVHLTFLEYANKFVESIAQYQKPYFGFFSSSSLSHDYFNKPKLGDDDYVRFFNHLHMTGVLTQTILIFISDHGIRWGNSRASYQGRMEERLPLVYIALPEWYRTRYPQAYSNLQNNKRRLTTPYDLHETLIKLSKLYTLTSSNLSERVLNRNNTARGISLFEPIPNSRTCDDAGISSHWCTCQQSFEISKEEQVVVEAAHFAVDYMNKQLEGYAICANLILNEILDARIHKPIETIFGGDIDKKEYTINFKTFPGDGIFEVTVTQLTDEGGNYKLGITGTSRLNLYGKQSLCMPNFRLKLYCYCNNYLDIA